MCRIRCVIVDDEPLAVEMLAGFVGRTPSLELAGSYTDPVLAVSQIRAMKPDIVFLDIQMPDLNGLELSRMLPEGCRVIFTTAFREYALEGYEVEALDYLLKPLSYKKFLEAITKAEKWMALKSRPSAEDTDRRSSAFIKADGAFRNIEFADILYITGMKDYVMFTLSSEEKPLVTHMTMKSVEEMLPAGKFMRVHRSHIVALERISAVDSCGDIVIGKDTIPVSDSYRRELDAYVRQKML